MSVTASKLCECGCGEDTQALRFIHGHNGRRPMADRISDHLTIVADRGYETPCLEWDASKTDFGYGRIRTESGSVVHVHRAIWTLAHGDPGELHVCHRCDNPPCARLDHLSLGTPAANMQDAVDKGRVAIGERHSQSRLTEAQVIAIRASTEIYRARAERYGVTMGTISDVVNRRTWKHVP